MLYHIYVHPEPCLLQVFDSKHPMAHYTYLYCLIMPWTIHALFTIGHRVISVFNQTGEPGIKGLEMGVVPLSVTHSDSRAKLVFPVSMTICYTGLVVLVPSGGMFPPENTTMIPMNWKLRMLFSHFALLMPLDQQAKKGITVSAGMTDPDPDYQGETGQLLHNGGNAEYVWNRWDPLGCP